MFHGGWEDGSVGSVDRSALLGKAESAVTREKKSVEDRRLQQRFVFIRACRVVTLEAGRFVVNVTHIQKINPFLWFKGMVES